MNQHPGHILKGRSSAERPSPFSAGLKGVCPSCGQSSLYVGLLNIKDNCEVCGHSYENADPGDGAQVFVILILGGVATLLALLLESISSPPLWVHLLVWGIFIVFASLWMLRVVKAMLIALQYRYDAHEARVIPDQNSALPDMKHLEIYSKEQSDKSDKNNQGYNDPEIKS